jgi:uncharacterized protein involved in exopolysaccharide biosynthesis
VILSDTRSHEDRFFVPDPLTVLKRNKVPILLSAIMGLVPGAVGYATAPPNYVSEAVLVLDARRIQALPTEAVVSTLPQESPVLSSEIDIIGATMMATKVAERLQQRQITFPAENAGRGTSSNSSDNLRPPEPATTLPKEIGPTVEEMAQRLVEGLSVTNDGRSYTIHIAFRDGDPSFAVQVADAFAETYIDYQVEFQQQETLRVSNWLGGKLDSLRTRLEVSEKAGQEFRRSAGLVEVDGSSLPAQRVARLSDELIQAGAALAGAQARLEAARRLWIAPMFLPSVNSFSQQQFRHSAPSKTKPSASWRA